MGFINQHSHNWGGTTHRMYVKCWLQYTRKSIARTYLPLSSHEGNIYTILYLYIYIHYTIYIYYILYILYTIYTIYYIYYIIYTIYTIYYIYYIIYTIYRIYNEISCGPMIPPGLPWQRRDINGDGPPEAFRRSGT